MHRDLRGGCAPIPAGWSPAEAHQVHRFLQDLADAVFFAHERPITEVASQMNDRPDTSYVALMLLRVLRVDEWPDGAYEALQELVAHLDSHLHYAARAVDGVEDDDPIPF
jgi:hypothetical protein